jgi:hypothetical protein
MEELERALGSDAAFLADHYGAKREGNVAPARDPHGDFTGRNILAQVRPLTETASRHKMEPQAANDVLLSCLGRLRIERSKRIRPHLDDKVVAGWNGLMISALAQASAAPAESLADRRPEYLAAALRAAEFIGAEMMDIPGGIPRRSWRRGVGSGPGFSEDCAFIIQAWLDLYEATFDITWLGLAEKLQGAMDAGF